MILQKATRVIQRHVRRYLTLKRFKEECIKNALNSDLTTEELSNETLSEEISALTESTSTNFSTSPMETASRHLGFLPNLESRAVGSWFDPLETKSDEFSPQNYFSQQKSRQMTFNLTRGRVTPLAILMCNSNNAKPHSTTADEQSFTVSRLPVNRRSTILSRRDIEKVTRYHKSFFMLLLFTSVSFAEVQGLTERFSVLENPLSSLLRLNAPHPADIHNERPIERFHSRDKPLNCFTQTKDSGLVWYPNMAAVSFFGTPIWPP